jgi:adenosylmethionine-8-amino-7-oxononanoate aminotransferase
MDGHANPAADAFAADLLGLLPPGFGSVYCCSTGTACCEIAIQLARDFHEFSGNPRRIIVSIEGAYHGNSAMMSEVSQFGPWNRAYRIDDSTNHVKLLRPYCYRCPLGRSRPSCGEACADVAVEQLSASEPAGLAAVIVEYVQGAGVISLPRRYVEGVLRFAHERGVIVIADEVLTGFGRTGVDFAFQRYVPTPDLVCLSKALSNGLLPLAATVLNETISTAFYDREIQIGSTQDGNPVCAALGSAVVAHYRDYDWAGRSRRLGAQLLQGLRDRLADCPIVGEVRGEGLLVCVELVEDRGSRVPFGDMASIHSGFLERGVFVFVEQNYIVFVPPYVIDEDIIDLLVGTTASVLAQAKFPAFPDAAQPGLMAER